MSELYMSASEFLGRFCVYIIAFLCGGVTGACSVCALCKRQICPQDGHRRSGT